MKGVNFLIIQRIVVDFKQEIVLMQIGVEQIKVNQEL